MNYIPISTLYLWKLNFYWSNWLLARVTIIKVHSTKLAQKRAEKNIQKSPQPSARIDEYSNKPAQRKSNKPEKKLSFDGDEDIDRLHDAKAETNELLKELEEDLVSEHEKHIMSINI